MKLHADWPEYPGDDKWDSTNPHGELVSAFDDAPTFATAEPVSVSTTTVSVADVESIDGYYIESNDGAVREPGVHIGTELSMVLLGKLHDGRWFSLVGWNDYTGWGCQSGADIRIGGTREEVIKYGLDNTERERLGLS